MNTLSLYYPSKIDTGSYLFNGSFALPAGFDICCLACFHDRKPVTFHLDHWSQISYRTHARRTLRQTKPLRAENPCCDLAPHIWPEEKVNIPSSSLIPLLQTFPHQMLYTTADAAGGIPFASVNHVWSEPGLASDPAPAPNRRVPTQAA